jgi:hypothetical protein
MRPYILLPLTLIIIFLSCKDHTVRVQDVTLENVETDSPIPEPPLPTGEIQETNKIDRPHADSNITLTLNYNAIACSCAQWSESRYNDQPERRQFIFLEKGNDKLQDADDLWKGDNLPLRVKVVGQFLPGTGYPKGYHLTKGDPKPAKIFRYISITILNNGL